jgi:hypothetical protein
VVVVVLGAYREKRMEMLAVTGVPVLLLLNTQTLMARPLQRGHLPYLFQADLGRTYSTVQAQLTFPVKEITWHILHN